MTLAVAAASDVRLELSIPSVSSTIARRDVAGTPAMTSVAALRASKIAVSPPATARSIAPASAALFGVSCCGMETDVLNVMIAA